MSTHLATHSGVLRHDLDEGIPICPIYPSERAHERLAFWICRAMNTIRLAHERLAFWDFLELPWVYGVHLCPHLFEEVHASLELSNLVCH